LVKVDASAWQPSPDWSEVDARHNLPVDAWLTDYVVATLPYAEDHLREELAMLIAGTRQVARALGVTMDPENPTMLVSPYGVTVEVKTELRKVKGDDYTIPELYVRAGKRDPGVAHVLVCYLGNGLDPVVVGWVWNHVLEAQGKLHLTSGQGERQGHLSMPPSRLRPIGELVVANPWRPREPQLSMF
jgi:hypothetical protein